MPAPEAQFGLGLPETEVLTLAEAASYLRVSEEAVLELVGKDALPARRIGDEWRFLKRAVVAWLGSGRYPPRVFAILDLPLTSRDFSWQYIVKILESQVIGELNTVERASVERGSKGAVLGQFAVFQGDDDLEEQLADIRARREAAGG